MTDLTIGGETFNVLIEGDDTLPVAMLCHPLGGDLHLFDALAPELAKRFRVVRYDSRGHGGSVVSDGPYSIARLGTDALAILDALGIDKVHWIGVSKGGAVGQWLLVNAPARIERAVLANTAAQLGPPDSWNDRIVRALAEGMNGVAEATLPRWFSPDFADAAAVEPIGAAMRATAPKGYAATCAALRDLDLRESLHGIAHPVLVIHGRDDPSVSEAQARLLAETIPLATLRILPGRHMVAVEEAEAFNKAIVDFLSAKAPTMRVPARKTPTTRPAPRRGAGRRTTRPTETRRAPVAAKRAARKSPMAAKTTAKTAASTPPARAKAKAAPAKRPAKQAAPAARATPKAAAKPTVATKRRTVAKPAAVAKAKPAATAKTSPKTAVAPKAGATRGSAAPARRQGLSVKAPAKKPAAASIAKPKRAKPGRATPGRAKPAAKPAPSRTKTTRTTQAKISQAKTTQAKTTQAKTTQAKTTQAKAAKPKATKPTIKPVARRKAAPAKPAARRPARRKA